MAMSIYFNRRSALLALGSAGVLSACALVPDQAPATSSPSPAKVFLHGVASGDPDTTSVVLWTRISGATDDVPVTWEVASDAAFNNVVRTGTQSATAAADFTVKVIAGDLSPGERIYFRFKALEEISPTGRTKALPAGRVENFGIALASCSNYCFGHFNAYDAIAKDDAIDLVLHTGDYIYEYGAGEWGHETASTIGRAHNPAHEMVTLEDYRLRHAQYKTDPASQAMHAAHPFVACWDDHESTNNPWTDGAGNHQPDTEGDWIQRRNASIQAYYEWMPVRDPATVEARTEFWRTYVIGDLATLITLETRHTARGEQVDYSRYKDTLKSPADRDAFMSDVIGDPARKMISVGMEDVLATGLSRSVAAGEPWRVIGNASPIARMLVPDVQRFGITPADAPAAEQPGAGPNLFWKGEWNLPFYTDTWDGYPAAREAFYALCRAAGAGDLLVLTGDSHSFWANTLSDASGQPMGLEVGTAGITSPGDFVESGWLGESPERLDRVFEAALDEVRWTDNLHQGYVRVVLGRTEARVSYVAVDTVLRKDYAARVIREETIERGPGTIAWKA
jgi:alkaline phosphatase D